MVRRARVEGPVVRTGGRTVPQRPSGLAQEHVVQARLGQPERADGQACLVEQPEQPGQRGGAVAGVQPDRVARHGELAHAGLPGQLGGSPRGARPRRG